MSETAHTTDDPIRVYLLDDHEVVRRGLRDLLEQDGDIVVVGESGLAQEATRRIPALRPHVAVLDGRLPDGSGIDVCREIRSRHPEIAALILTSFDDDEALFSAIMAGAAGYVLKQIRGTDLVDAVRRVAAGQSMLDPAVTQQVLDRLRNGPEEDAALAPLTGQERRILELDRRGHDEPPDRRGDVPRREDGQELCVQPALQARDGTPYTSGGVRRQAPQPVSRPRDDAKGPTHARRMTLFADALGRKTG